MNKYGETWQKNTAIKITRQRLFIQNAQVAAWSVSVEASELPQAASRLPIQSCGKPLTVASSSKARHPQKFLPLEDFFCSLREIQSQSMRNLNVWISCWTFLQKATIDEGIWVTVQSQDSKISAHHWMHDPPDFQYGLWRQSPRHLSTVCGVPHSWPAAIRRVMMLLKTCGHSWKSRVCKFQTVHTKYHRTFYSEYNARLSIIAYMDLSWDLGVPKSGLPIWVEKANYLHGMRWHSQNGRERNPSYCSWSPLRAWYSNGSLDHSDRPPFNQWPSSQKTVRTWNSQMMSQVLMM